MVGRGGQPHARSDAGRSDALPSAPLRAGAALPADLYGWLGGLPKQHSAGVSRKVKRTVGRGRTALVAWPDLFIATVIKRTKKKRVMEIIRRMVQGSLARAEELLTRSRGGTV